MSTQELLLQSLNKASSSYYTSSVLTLQQQYTACMNIGAVSFTNNQTFTAKQSAMVRNKLLTAYQTSATGSLILPNGTLAQRDQIPVAGSIRFNADSKKFEGYDGTRWFALVASTDGRNLPTGTCISGIYTTIPEDFLSLDGSRIEKSDYYDLVNLLWNFSTFRGDGSTYAILPNMHHRFLEGTTTLSEVATYVEAGLPNISGTIDTGVRKVDKVNESQSGALYHGNYGDNSNAYGGGYNTKHFQIVNFNASKSNGIYLKSTTVQPLAMCVSVVVKS